MIFDFIEQSAAGSGFVYKNTTAGYVYSAASFTATVGTGTSVMTISAVTAGTVVIGMTVSGGTLGGTATIVSFGTFDGTSGTVNLSGTDTWANPTAVSGQGFIQITDIDYPTATVRGIVYLDGTYYVMTPDAKIYGSEIDNPFVWTSLNMIQALAEPDLGIALFRQLNLIVAFGEYSTEFFYDAANPAPGSPLLPYSSAFLEVGCASAGSIAQAENTLFFMGKAKQKGRSIYLLEGTQPKVISNPFIDRILNSDDLVNVTSVFIKIAGHGFYLLTLPTTGITLAYDVNSQLWAKWTQMYLSATLDISSSSITWTNGLVTIVYNGHGLIDGQYTTLSSSTPSTYNGNYVINVVDANTFTFPISADPGTYTSGASLAVYLEQFFNMGSYTKAGNLDLVQDSTTGTVYTVATGTYTDNSLPIRYQIRTSKLDSAMVSNSGYSTQSKSNREKYYAKVELIGDKVSGTAYVRYSNDDYQTWSKYRPVDLAAQRSQLYRQGRGRRRAYEIINYDNQPIRLEALEITAVEGVR